MSPTESMSIRPREAAVTAALAGAVVVVLAYASGFGLHTPLVAAPVSPVPRTASATPEPTSVPATALPPVVVAVPVHEPPVAAGPAPPPTPAATPLPTIPIPSATPTSPCEPGLLDGLLTPIGSLVDGLLGADLLGNGVLGNGVLGNATGPVGCTIGTLLGSACCDSATATKEAAR
jgi:hypothetical protein